MKQTINTLVFLFSIGVMNIYGQVVVNEYSASNLGSYVDSYLKSEDWIELYNQGNEAVDLSGFYLSDKESKPLKWRIPDGASIPANGFITFWCSGRDEAVSNEYHTNFKLTQTKANEVISLSSPTGDLLGSHPMEITLVEHSRCRKTDGADEWVICTDSSYGGTNNNSEQFSAYTTEPGTSLSAGFYDGVQKIILTNNEANSVLRFTIDGTNVTMDSPEYLDTIEIAKTTVIKSRSFSLDSLVHPGKMDFNTYFIDEDFSLPVFSVAANEVLELANGEGDRIPIGSLEYFVGEKREATSFGSLNRHGQDSWVLDHRSIDWVSRDEMGYSKAVEAPLFNYSDRDSYQKFMFRNSGDDNYPAIDDFEHQGSTHIRDEYVQQLSQDANMELDLRAVERVILFLNGEYWGVYGMRERPVDHDYTDYYYDQGKYEVQYLTTWGFTEIQYGGEQARTDWEELRDFILENDMGIEENYKIADDSINLVSMIDYMLVNLTVVASDWLNYNTGWWRGLNPDGKHKKWGYILWDLDATFDYYINYSGVPNISPDAAPCDLEEIASFMEQWFGFGYDDVGQHEKLFLKLLEESEVFEQLYYSRYADLMNTVYTCENMMTTLDSMLNTIRPEMPRQIDRWGGTMDEWEANVQRLKNFIEARCELTDDGMLGCYEELSGPYALTLMTQPPGIGEIDINSIDVETFPWVGNYYGGMENTIKAKVFAEYEDDFMFGHWETTGGSEILPDELSRKAGIVLTQPDTLIAVFDVFSSIDELDFGVSMAAYPNPASDQLNITFELEDAKEISFSLQNMLGQKILEINSGQKRYASGTHQEVIQLSDVNIQSGLYFIVAQFDSHQKSIKIEIVK